MTLTLYKSQVHCFAVMSLQFTHVRSLPAEAGCETRERMFYYNGLCCVTITCQQIFEDALQVTVVGVLPHVTIKCRRLGGQCSETVTADSGKARRFKPMVGELRVADVFCVALLDENSNISN